jgi:prolyl oligopeptidase
VSRAELCVLAVCLVGSLTLLWACSPLWTQRHISYPAAPRAAVVDNYHGIKVADPYRPLEDLDAPATRSWVSAQAQLTQQYLAAIPERARIAKRLAELYSVERIGIPFKAGGRYLFQSNSGHEEQSTLMSGASLEEAPTLVLDPNTLTGGEHPVVTGYVASHDGRFLAYGVSSAGSDWTEWRIRDLGSGADLADVLRFTKYYRPVFTPDATGLYYSAFPPPSRGTELSSEDFGDAVYFHALGSTSSDRPVLADPAHPSWQYQPHLTPDGRWLVVLVGDGQVGDRGRNDVMLVDLSATPAKTIALTRDSTAAFVYAGAAAGRLYFLTSLHAPNGRVLAVDPQRPAPENWQEVIPEGTDAIDLGVDSGSVTLVGGQLIVRTLHDAHHRVAAYGLDGKLRREVALPGAGSVAGFEGEEDAEETFYAFSNLVTAPTVYRYDLASGRSTVIRAPAPGFDPELFEQQQVFYRGKDGTRIPMWLAWRKGLEPRARNPLLLWGYGGFGIPVLPAFQPARIAWLEMGGVFAIANIRGGGEYGEPWHRAGTLAHKQVVFDDFIAAAQWLIAQRYTSAAQLAIYGRSNGGLLVGACLTQRPDLFGATVAGVGVLDMLRFNRFGQGAGWEGDYGSPQDPQQFRALYAYSPLHRVRAGTRYPATLIITGDHDTRVMPMHSFKFAAALQAAQAGRAPILLDIESEAGHGGGGTVSQTVSENADIYAFLVKNLAHPAQR